MEIDLNCDLGEGSPHDAELMPLITSANIACGFHAGDPAIAHATLDLAARYSVRAGAHPGFPDREGFGRRELRRTQQQIYDDVVYQIGALSGLARAAGLAVAYIKAHGALYNMACADDGHAEPVVAAAALFGLPLVGLPHSRLEARSKGRCPFVPEGFADRRYRPDGTLVPRGQADAFVNDLEEAVRQVRWLIQERGVRTICVHGDNPQALAFVKKLRESLERQGLVLRPFA
jgi:UPF0271 protein